MIPSLGNRVVLLEVMVRVRWWVILLWRTAVTLLSLLVGRWRCRLLLFLGR